VYESDNSDNTCMYVGCRQCGVILNQKIVGVVNDGQVVNTFNQAEKGWLISGRWLMTGTVVNHEERRYS